MLEEISNEILEKQDFNTFPLEKEEIFEGVNKDIVPKFKGCFIF